MIMEQQVHGLQQCGQRSPVIQHPHISFNGQKGNNISSNSPVNPIAVMGNNWSGANCSLDSPCNESPRIVPSPVFFRSCSPNPQVSPTPLPNSSHFPLLQQQQQQQQQSAPLIEHQQQPMMQVISPRCPNSNSNCNNSGNNIMMSPYHHYQQPQEQQQQQHTHINNSNSGSNNTHQSCNSSVSGAFQLSSRYPPNTIIINPAGVTPMSPGRVTPVYNGGCSTPVGYVTPGRVTPGRIVSGRCTPVFNMPCKKRYVDYMLASTASTVAIDNKIEQAMDLVKSHLMFAVREEVDVLKEKIGELMERINHLEYENTVLKKYATQDTLQQLQHNAPNP